jgi:hypothetical protein
MAIYIAAPQLEMPVLIGSLACGIGSFFIWRTARQRYKKFVEWLSIAWFTLALFLAILHGWGAAVQITFLVLGIGLTMTTIVLLWRIRRVFTVAMEALEETNEETGKK